MIQIQASTAVVLYGLVLLLLMAAIWLFSELAGGRVYNVLAKQHLWRCAFCGYTYLDEGAASLSLCPRCESFNSAADKSARFVRARSHEPPEAHVPDQGSDSRRNTSRRKRPHQRRRGPRKR